MIDLRKNMKRMLTVVMCLLVSTCLASAQQKHRKSSFGTDLGSAVSDGRIKTRISHQICERWSAEGWIAIRMATRERDPEEVLHRSEFSDIKEGSGKETGRQDAAGISFQFWTSRVYDGPFIAIGAVTDMKGKEDCTLGFGYEMKIWKCFSVIVSLEMNLIETFAVQKFKGEGTGLCICMTF